jgi:hypothetical protein
MRRNFGQFAAPGKRERRLLHDVTRQRPFDMKHYATVKRKPSIACMLARIEIRDEVQQHAHQPDRPDRSPLARLADAGRTSDTRAAPLWHAERGTELLPAPHRPRRMDRHRPRCLLQPRILEIEMSRFSFVLTSLFGIAGLVMLVNIWTEAAPAHAQVSQEMRAHVGVIKDACRKDYERLCSGVLPGGHRIVKCLRANAGSLSPDCAQGLAEAKAYKDRANGAGDLPPK